VEEAESGHDGGLQIQKLFRSGAEMPIRQDTVIQSGDVITVTGRVSSINAFDDHGLTETTESVYLQISLSAVELIVTENATAEIPDLLSRGGIMLTGVIRNGKKLLPAKAGAICTGDHLLITGPSASVTKTAAQLGYIKDTGDTTDVSFMSLAIVIGILLGSLYIDYNSVPLALGASGGALVLGLLCGWMYHKNPRMGYIPSSARWFIKSVGLNLFIAATALNSAQALGSAIGWHCIPLLLAGAVVTILPHVISVFFARRALRMDPVDTLGALCGSATCTAALNGLIEETDSASFASSYSPAYAVGNILLTVIGIAVSLII